jgi:hypothetical protein
MLLFSYIHSLVKSLVLSLVSASKRIYRALGLSLLVGGALVPSEPGRW